MAVFALVGVIVCAALFAIGLYWVLTNVEIKDDDHNDVV